MRTIVGIVFFVLLNAIIPMSVHAQADSTKHGVRNPVKFPEDTLFLHKEMVLDLLASDSILIAKYPYLRKAILRERLLAYVPFYKSSSQQFQGYAQLTPFEAMSLAAKRHQELFGHTTSHGKIGQLDLLAIIQFIIDLFK